jgi:hypothetical protein
LVRSLASDFIDDGWFVLSVTLAPPGDPHPHPWHAITHLCWFLTQDPALAGVYADALALASGWLGTIGDIGGLDPLFLDIFCLDLDLIFLHKLVKSPLQSVAVQSPTSVYIVNISKSGLMNKHIVKTYRVTISNSFAPMPINVFRTCQ